ncbi:SDR family NAD(P)-dependent oxidoreductase [Marinobacter sp.]|uniref:SDR family NAD(P)-dependent oxidoreductase n=1 Tax=Marinobacter sp. TaxID=50741 RepID=UPI00384E0006
MNRLRDKIAIVTGGAVGIGRATAQRMAEEGATVVIADIQDDEGRVLAESINNEGGQATYWHCNVGDERAVVGTVQGVVDEFGRLDVLVNNAGISGANRPSHELTEDEWDEVQIVNVKGVFFCTKAAIPHMRASGGGSIINLSSIYGLVGAPDIPAYHASKGAVHLMTKTDALTYASDRIRVNSVHPGFIWTPLVEKFLEDQGDVAEGRRSLDSLHPLGHVGEPDDVAWGIVYLASDEAGFVTGTELVIDGGYTAR